MSGGSRYLYAKACSGAASCTASFGITSFLAYLRYIENNGNFPDDRGKSPWEPQSFLMEQQCGKPCKYDYLLHTETMQQDWIKLMDKMGEPRALLPHDINPTVGKERLQFTKDVLGIIHRLDANMFDEWGFEKRDESFNLRVSFGSPH